MNKLVVMCGLPGSGKSMFADRLAAEENFVVHSSDKIREELGDVNDQSKNEEVFRLLHKRIKYDLNSGKNVCMDATNLNRRKRMAFLREIKKIPCRKICVLVATPWEVCMDHNRTRDRKVPDEVIMRMLKSFQMPSVSEGFDEVYVHYEREEWKTYYGDVIDRVKSLQGFDQNNSHHELSLGNHMLKAGDHALYLNGRVYDDVVLAAFTHDIGKVHTKSFVDKNGVVTDEAHYYSHHNLGSYISLFFDYPKYGNNEYIALLIENHMRPLMEWKQNEKSKEKDRKIFGDQFINDVMLLHEADVYAH